MSVHPLHQENPEENAKERPSQATKLVGLTSKYPLFHDQFSRAFISIQQRGHVENWLVDSEEFHQLLAYRYYKNTHNIASKSAIKDAIATINGQARFEGGRTKTYLRAAVIEDGYQLDLCDDDWVSLEITKENWTLTPNSPAAFYRSKASSTLPRPIPGGTLEPLWEVANIPEQSRLLVITFLLECLRPDTNYPILVMEGEQGSAKSTTQAFLKELIDPSAMLLRVPPKKIQDVFVGAANDYILSFNNLSHIPAELQDALCCLSTGGTHAERALYTNNQEVATNIQRPIMLNGIGGLVTRQDLLERTIYLDLPRIKGNTRKTEKELNEFYAAQKPKILGALLDIMVSALRFLPEIPQGDLPRMADYCLLGRAVAVAMGLKPLQFDEAYTKNQRAALERGLESCAIYPALVSLLETQHLGFGGTYQELLNRLRQYRDIEVKGWPQTSKGLANTLKRQAPALRKVGIDIQFDEKRRQNGYYVSIEQRDS